MMRRASLPTLFCPYCHGSVGLVETEVSDPVIDGALRCETCGRLFEIEEGIVHFIRSQELIGPNKTHERLNNLLSHFFKPAMKLMFALCGGEEQARNECMDRLHLKEGARILEIGIGTGDNIDYLRRRLSQFEIFGVDIARSMLRHCVRNQMRADCSAELFLAQAESLPFKDGTFDVVYHIGAINFFTDQQRAIEEMIRVARPGTKVLIADENERALKVLDKFLFQLLVGQRDPVEPPIAAIPKTMLDVRLETIWRGYGYCIEFWTPLG